MSRHYASLDILMGSGEGTAREAKEELLNWLRENVDRLDEDNVEAVEVPDMAEEEKSETLKTGDRVVGITGNKQVAGTVEALLLIGSRGPEAFVRFDNGELRKRTVDRITLLD